MVATWVPNMPKSVSYELSNTGKELKMKLKARKSATPFTVLL